MNTIEYMLFSMKIEAQRTDLQLTTRIIQTL
jgi:hypothetical protein